MVDWNEAGWRSLKVGGKMHGIEATYIIENAHGNGLRASGADKHGDKLTIWFTASEESFDVFCERYGIKFGDEKSAESAPQAPTSGEVRITDPNTGGQKGSKQCQVGAVDPLALLAIGEVAGFGGEKYARYNFARGYAWSLSFDAMQRHLLAFWSGEEIDPESGKPHLAHAAWHCMTLMTFSMRNRGTDDRMHRYLEELDQ